MRDFVSDLRAVLFDFGGTLDGPGVPWNDRFAAAYREAGLDVDQDRLRAAAGHGTREAYRAPHVAGCDLRDTVAFHVRCQFDYLGLEDRRAVDAIVATFVARATKELAASRTVLERLGRRFRLGVVSNYYGNVDRTLADAGIAPLLSVIVDSTVAGVSKPDPAIFSLALARLHLQPAQALVVGDSLEQDIRPAHGAGMRTAWLVGAREMAVHAPADLCVRTLVELERVLSA